MIAAYTEGVILDDWIKDYSLLYTSWVICKKMHFQELMVSTEKIITIVWVFTACQALDIVNHHLILVTTLESRDVLLPLLERWGKGNSQKQCAQGPIQENVGLGLSAWSWFMFLISTIESDVRVERGIHSEVTVWLRVSCQINPHFWIQESLSKDKPPLFTIAVNFLWKKPTSYPEENVK